jgi:hypothetical protein
VEHVKPAHVWGILLAVLLVACVMPAGASVYFTSSTSQVITKGDTFSVSGTGAVNGTVALWITGRNYFDVRSTAPDRHGNFSFILKPTDTEKFSGGQYAIILQDPGPDGTMEIEPGKDSNGNLTISNRGKIIARLGARQDLTGNVEHITDILLSAEDIQGVDDTFLPESFFVEEPAVYFDQLGPGTGALPDQVSGEAIVITGTTNAGTENSLRAGLYNRDTNEQLTEKILPVVAGGDINHWTCTFESPGLQPGNYDISVGWMKSNTSGTGMADFAVVKAPPPGEQPVRPPSGPASVPQLPQGLDTLLIIGILFVFAVTLYTFLKR